MVCNEQHVLSYDGHITSVKSSSKPNITKVTTTTTITTTTTTYQKQSELEDKGDPVTMTDFPFLVNFLTRDIYIDEIGIQMHFIHYACNVSNHYGIIICSVT